MQWMGRRENELESIDIGIDIGIDIDIDIDIQMSSNHK
jgi:hypothetical protein